MTAPDDILEDEAYNCPRNIVDGAGRGNSASSREDDGEAIEEELNRALECLQ
jgi:hypothetical protein